MVGVHDGFYSKNTPVRPPLVTTKGTCRGPYCRLHSTRSRTTKARGIWHNTNYNSTKPPNQPDGIPIHTIVTMGHNYNKFYLSTPDGPKIPNRILFCQSHSTCYCGSSDPNTMKLHRSNSSDNRPWSNIIHTILPSQLKLRTNPQPYHNSRARPPNPPPLNSCLMTASKSHKPSPPSNN